jgi:hypothetical protein
MSPPITKKERNVSFYNRKIEIQLPKNFYMCVYPLNSGKKCIAIATCSFKINIVSIDFIK